MSECRATLFNLFTFFLSPTTRGKRTGTLFRLVFMSGVALTFLEKVVEDVLKKENERRIPRERVSGK
jgi:hypothetical protein